MESGSKLVVAAACTLLAGASVVAHADGKAVFEKTCAVCHATGVVGAPKLGDKAAWGERIGRGKDALAASALGGKGAMPAKGGNPQLSDDDVRAAVDFMMQAVK